ncbi:MBL fold metallo-hydrolase [Bacillus salipaludis]|uniref:MBL fold metallo-hydrolase n=1 Tax=Bacillus salipaludis TaxID=2547811 RepID=A0A4R5VKF6_9BACI|nr:MBL fold metallo-hydrolase [Bacillus salipaludis]MDQ6598900.1 MBL fold metallo-hydrolase [Bacillus salipaludis]TDK58199.1 MBL fold metallo-hydrolase [Bacillus salipaludis]
MNRYGIYQVTIPLPFWNGNVHCYLAQREGKWTIIDTAMNQEVTRESWKATFSKHGINPKHDVERILITHHHADHFEYARELQQQTGADVFLSEKEQSLALSVLDRESFTEFYLAAGMSKELVKQLQPVNKIDTSFPNNLFTIDTNRLYPIGELLFEALHMPGHSDGHICFYNREEQLLLSGDHLTKEAIPYISYHGYGDENPLSSYLATLKRIKLMKISLVLPGHGPIFTDVQERITELLHHYEERIGFVLEQITGEMNAYEVSQSLFPVDSSVFDQWIAIGETNAYLRYLASIGEISVYKKGKQFKYVRM